MARIVVVDDDPAVRTSLARYLRSLGHEIVEAENGHGAVAALRTDPADVVLTDINMPDMDGIEVLSAVARQCPGVPVIAMSGGGQIPKGILLDSASLLGAFATIAKPFETDELKRVIDAALERGSGGASGAS